MILTVLIATIIIIDHLVLIDKKLFLIDYLFPFASSWLQ